MANFTWYQILWGSSVASKIDFQVFITCDYNSFMDFILHEVVQNEEEEVDRDSKNDPTQVSSSMASSLFQEAIFHEDNIQVAAINIVEYLYLHSMFSSFMSSITNEDDFLVGDHSEPSLEDGFLHMRVLVRKMVKEKFKIQVKISHFFTLFYFLCISTP